MHLLQSPGCQPIPSTPPSTYKHIPYTGTRTVTCTPHTPHTDTHNHHTPYTATIHRTPYTIHSYTRIQPPPLSIHVTHSTTTKSQYIMRTCTSVRALSASPQYTTVFSTPFVLSSACAHVCVCVCVNLHVCAHEHTYVCVCVCDCVTVCVCTVRAHTCTHASCTAAGGSSQATLTRDKLNAYT